MADHSSDVTRLLHAWSTGDRRAGDDFFAQVYGELCVIARRHMQRERPEHTLQPAALVHETYLRLVEQKRTHWQDRAHFFGVAALIMRRVLLKHAKGRRAAKRGRGMLHIDVVDSCVATRPRGETLVALDGALSQLAAIVPRQAKSVELRFFEGMTEEETAETLGVSPVTVKRDWRTARAWLERTLNGPRVTHACEPRTRGRGRRVGPYRLVREIGRGGMGIVYLAEGVVPHKTPVAIKVVRPDVAIPIVLDQFRREQQLLAGLTHPNIVTLLDSGKTGEGLPYLVMDHIDGGPIDTYCTREHLSTSARLRLFLEVCKAVGYAHERSIVHRDLKPSNVLVTSRGVPKLLDFGVSTLCASAGSDVDRWASIACMTPEYASPEQRRGERATVESDIYSLGILLKRLLPGRGHPERALAAIARHATHQNPTGRYPSVAALAADIRRHLSDRPATAHAEP